MLDDIKILNWRRRKLVENKKGIMIWIIDELWVGSMIMNKYSIVILNPLDKQPHVIDESGIYYQYQHGDIHISEDSMSMALVYRVVNEYYYYNIVTNIMINQNIGHELSTKDLEDQQKRLSLYQIFDKIQYHYLMLKLFYSVILKNELNGYV